jgi:N-acyl-D-amino-acid deacylase
VLLVARYGGPAASTTGSPTWRTNGASVNVGSFLGGNNVRTYAKGASQGPASPAELDSMRHGGALGHGRRCLRHRHGAHLPARHLRIHERNSSRPSRAMAPYGGIYITHKRSEADQYLEALDEAIRIGAEAGVPWRSTT